MVRRSDRAPATLAGDVNPASDGVRPTRVGAVLDDLYRRLDERYLDD